MFYLLPSAVCFLAGDLFAQPPDFLLFSFITYNKVHNNHCCLSLSLLVFTKMDLRPESLSQNDRLQIWEESNCIFQTQCSYFYAKIFPGNNYLTAADLQKLSLERTKQTPAGSEVVCLHPEEFVRCFHRGNQLSEGLSFRDPP